MKRIFKGLLVLPAVFMFTLTMNTRSVEAQDVITWRLPIHHTTTASPVYEHSIMKIANLVEKRSDGRLVLDPYLGGTLMDGPDIFNAVKRGVVPIGHTSSAYELDQVPLFNVAAGLPMNFKDYWEAAYFFKWLGFEQMLKDNLLEDHGLLYFSDRVYPTELSLKKPVESMDDFDGMKLRSSGILQRYLTSIGAAASFLPGGDIYTALASGMMDGAHWGAVQGAYAMNFYEINKYHLSTPINVAATDIWLINKNEFDKLPGDIQKILVETLEEHFWPRTNQYIYQEKMKLQEAIEEYEITAITLPEEEFAKMQAAAIKIWDEIAEKSPECAEAVEMLKEFNRELGRLE